MRDRLRPAWDFNDLDASEARFRAQLGLEPDNEGRAEVLTQLARVEALRDRFEESDRLLDEARLLGGSSPLVRARIDLERGRVRRSSGNPEAGVPLFEAAFETACQIGHEFLAADAAHMVAIAASDPDTRLAWAQRGMDIAQRSADPDVAYWLGPLLNNLGWDFYEAGDYDAALDAFERALTERERFPERPAEIAIARYAVSKALHALGRPAEAAAQAERAVAWTQEAGEPDGWFHQELAEAYTALGRETEAREQARLALSLFQANDPSFSEDAERAGRLHELAGESADR